MNRPRQHDNISSTTHRTQPVSRRRRGWRCVLAAATMAGALAGCGSPPSVTPLMRVVDESLQAELDHLTLDAADAEKLLAERQGALKRAMELDVREQPALAPDWVLDQAGLYVTAREAVLSSHLAEQQSRLIRLDNLRAAREAQARAIELLEKQDALLDRTLGLDLWRLPQSRLVKKTLNR